MIKIGIIGLGYVGLPLAALFGTKFKVIGFDINSKRVDEIMSGRDNTLELTSMDLEKVLVKNINSEEKGLQCSTQLEDIEDCNYYVITVPTPVDDTKRPVFTPLIKASETVGKVLKEGRNDEKVRETVPGDDERLDRFGAK